MYYFDKKHLNSWSSGGI